MFIDKDLYNYTVKSALVLLAKERKLPAGDVARFWENSKTRKILCEVDTPMDHISNTQLYDELCKEMDNDPYWMCNPL